MTTGELDKCDRCGANIITVSSSAGSWRGCWFCADIRRCLTCGLMKTRSDLVAEANYGLCCECFNRNKTKPEHTVGDFWSSM